MIRNYTVEEVAGLLWEHYGLEGRLKELGSFADCNFLLEIGATPQASTRYVVKISLQVEEQRLLLLQNIVLRELAHHKQEFNCSLPQIIPTKNQEDMVLLPSTTGKDFLRVLTFLEGEQIYELQDPPLHLFDQAGELAAKMSLFLRKMSVAKQVVELCTCVRAESNCFNLLRFNEHYEENHKFLDGNIAPIVDRIRQEFNEFLPVLQSLPKQIVHHDICLTNLLVAKHPQNGQYHISGLIDFSDLSETHGILELVVLAARINLYKEQPLRNALRVIASFNRVKQLAEEERRVLFPLIKARLALLTMSSSRLAAEKGDDPYFQRCKSGILSYLVTLANACTNSEFEAILDQQIPKNP